jgi:hypothetical protein
MAENDAAERPGGSEVAGAQEPTRPDWQSPQHVSGQREPSADGTEIAVSAEDLSGEAQWVYLVDPAWQGANEDEDPPPAAVVGGWFVEADGSTGYFRPNPGYQPSEAGLPTDPVDAALQLVVSGEAEGDELLTATKDIIFGVAVDEDGVAVVAPAPDDAPSVLVTTAPSHRERVTTAGWVEATIEELVAALPDTGVDVLLNPGAPASIRLIAKSLKDFVAGEEGGTANAPEASRDSSSAGRVRNLV